MLPATFRLWPSLYHTWDWRRGPTPSPCHPAGRTPRWCYWSICSRERGVLWDLQGQHNEPCFEGPENDWFLISMFNHSRWKRLDYNLYPVDIIVKQQNSRACHFFGFHHCLQVGQKTHMLWHVSGQNLLEVMRKLIIFLLLSWLDLTMSMTIFLRVWRCFLLRLTKISQSLICTSLNATAKWWFSNTDSSLYIKASSDPDSSFYISAISIWEIQEQLIC